MLLAIDIGNTNSVFAVFEGETLQQSWRAQTVSRKTADEYAAFLQQVLSLADLDFSDIDGVVISSVVPEAHRHLSGLCSKYMNGIKPLYITHENAGIEVDLPQARQVGADRLVNAVAVKAQYSLPAIVISAEGLYAGGAIAPGVHLSIEALSRATAKLPKVSVKPASRAIAKSTDEAIEAGIFWGYIGMIEKISGQITAELDTKPTIIATGGLAPLFADHIDPIEIVDQNLTLKGLLKIYDQT